MLFVQFYQSSVTKGKQIDLQEYGLKTRAATCNRDH